MKLQNCFGFFKKALTEIGSKLTTVVVWWLEFVLCEGPDSNTEHSPMLLVEVSSSHISPISPGPNKYDSK